MSLEDITELGQPTNVNNEVNTDIGEQRVSESRLPEETIDNSDELVEASESDQDIESTEEIDSEDQESAVIEGDSEQDDDVETDQDEERSELEEDKPEQEQEDPTFTWEEGDTTYEDIPLSVLKRSHINEKLSTKRFQAAAELRKDAHYVLDQLTQHPGDAMEQLLGQEKMDTLLNDYYQKRWDKEKELGFDRIEDPEIRQRYIEGIRAKEEAERLKKLEEQRKQQEAAEQQAAQQKEAEEAVQKQLEDTMATEGVPINEYTIGRVLAAGESAINLGYDVSIPELVKQLKISLKKEGVQLVDKKAPKPLPKSNRRTGPTNAKKKPRGKKPKRLPTTSEWEEIFEQKFGQ